MRNYDVIVIGGGPAGLSAAQSACEKGGKVAIIEREARLGGILKQCVHDGFGLIRFGEKLAGPEYSERYIDFVRELDIDAFTLTFVTKIEKKDGGFVISAVSKDGIEKFFTKAIVLATGCRERTAKQVLIQGTRPSGVFTAGTAQNFVNLQGKLPTKKCVILGSGDIGLIMAHRMTTEGANVKLVLELMPFSSGLKRNIVQCLDDYNIPIKYSHTITRVVGKPRMTGLYYAPVGADRKPDLSKEEYISCDTLLLSVGLIPENDLLTGTSVEMSKVTNGAVVDEHRMTSVDGIFSCGNVLHVHDLVDNVSHEAEIAGESAAKYALGQSQKSSETVNVIATDGVRYALPQRISKRDGKVQIFFRVGDVYKNCKLVVTSGDNTLVSKKCMVLAPGEMGNVVIDKSAIVGDVTVRLEK